MSETASGSPVARHLVIRGLVQGVAYRASAAAEAARLGLDGWVRNRADGSVEALACGSEAAVEAFIEWARHGPPAARVSEVEVDAADPVDAGGFRIRRD